MHVYKYASMTQIYESPDFEEIIVHDTMLMFLEVSCVQSDVLLVRVKADYFGNGSSVYQTRTSRTRRPRPSAASPRVLLVSPATRDSAEGNRGTEKV